MGREAGPGAVGGGGIKREEREEEARGGRERELITLLF